MCTRQTRQTPPSRPCSTLTIARMYFPRVLSTILAILGDALLVVVANVHLQQQQQAANPQVRGHVSWPSYRKVTTDVAGQFGRNANRWLSSFHRAPHVTLAASASNNHHHDNHNHHAGAKNIAQGEDTEILDVGEQNGCETDELAEDICAQIQGGVTSLSSEHHSDAVRTSEESYARQESYTLYVCAGILILVALLVMASCLYRKLIASKERRKRLAEEEDSSNNNFTFNTERCSTDIRQHLAKLDKQYLILSTPDKKKKNKTKSGEDLLGVVQTLSDTGAYLDDVTSRVGASMKQENFYLTKSGAQIFYDSIEK